MNKKQFIKEIYDKGNFNGEKMTLRLPDVQRIADKLFENKYVICKNCGNSPDICNCQHSFEAVNFEEYKTIKKKNGLFGLSKKMV